MSFLYVYQEPAIKSLTQKQQAKVRQFQGQFCGWRILHVDDKIEGQFHKEAPLVVKIERGLYTLLKSKAFKDYDILDTVLDFGQTLEVVH